MLFLATSRGVGVWGEQQQLQRLWSVSPRASVWMPSRLFALAPRTKNHSTHAKCISAQKRTRTVYSAYLWARPTQAWPAGSARTELASRKRISLDARVAPYSPYGNSL